MEAEIYHYGWVKDPRIMQQKHRAIHKYWGNEATEAQKSDAEAFDYSGIDSLARFTETHPQVMQARISRQNWEFAHDISRKNLSLKYRLKMWVEKQTGWQIGEYQNFRF